MNIIIRMLAGALALLATVEYAPTSATQLKPVTCVQWFEETGNNDTLHSWVSGWAKGYVTGADLKVDGAARDVENLVQEWCKVYPDAAIVDALHAVDSYLRALAAGASTVKPTVPQPLPPAR